MTHVNIDYADLEERQPLLDLVAWFGLKRTKNIIRHLQTAITYAAINHIDMAMCWAGCQGHPNRRMIAHVLGEEVLQGWLDANQAFEDGDSEALKDLIPTKNPTN